MRLGLGVLVGLLLVSPVQAAMKVKLQVQNHSVTQDHAFQMHAKVTLYFPNGAIEEYGIGPELNADNATTAEAALTYLRQHAITFAVSKGMSPAPTQAEVFIFGGPQ